VGQSCRLSDTHRDCYPNRCRPTTAVREDAFCLFELGNTYLHVGRDFEATIRNHEASLELFRALDDRAYVSHVLWHQAIAFYALGETERAAALNLEGIALKREIGEILGTGKPLTNLAEYVASQGKSTEATQFLSESEAVYQMFDSSRGLAWVGNARGMLALLEGEVEQARLFAQEVEHITRRVDLPAVRARALHRLGVIACVDGDFLTARQLCVTARSLRPFFSDSLLIEFGLAMAAWGLGDFQQAKNHFRSMLDLVAMAPTLVESGFCLPIAAALLDHEDEQAQAAALLGLAFTAEDSPQRLFEKIPLIGDLSRTLEEELGTQAFQDAWEHGSQLDLPETVGGLIDRCDWQ
jgi:tetratricopeptide (TPR) repeat protein